METWPQHLVDCLKANDVRFMTYVPDKPIAKVVRLIEADPQVTAVCATREEEGVGLACGAYLGGKKGILLMQTGGVGNSINALSSLAIPQQLPFLMLITQRGELGEFNISQVPLGRALRPILDSLGIQHFTLADDTEAEMKWVIEGATKLAFASRTPVAIILAQGFDKKGASK